MQDMKWNLFVMEGSSRENSKEILKKYGRKNNLFSTA